MIGVVAMAYGIATAVAVLHQGRLIVRRGRSCEVSALLFAVYLGGYLIWLGYGLEIGSVPIVAVNVVGLVSTSVVLAIVLHLRGSLVNARSWRSCAV